MKNVRSRVVLRPTQLYAMYLNTSCHPVFLTDMADREIFLGQLLNGISGDTPSEEIVRKEIDDLLQGDIPVFYSDGDNRWLYDRDDKKIIPYFSQTGYELLLKKTDSLCENDREQQIRFIRISLELTENAPENIAVKKQILNHKESPLKRAVRSLYEILEKTSVKNLNATEVTWITAYRTANTGKKWELRPCDIYLYDGVAGIAQFVLGYEALMGNASFYLGELVKNTLFAYTDRILEDHSLLHTENTGAFTGEGALIHAYLSLYAISGEKEFLAYAKKHVPILEALLQEDTSYDLLSGNAGAILVLLQLFRTTREEKYLALAETAAGILLEHKTETESGTGWIIKGQEQILAGLSHGESGFALAFYYLYRETGKKSYGDVVQKILAYEDHLYSASHNNWLDYRGRKPGENGGDLAAWCHGTAGILVARHQMADMDFLNISKDKTNAVRKTLEAMNRSGWCLCHGKLGNALILQEVLGNDFQTDLWNTAAHIVSEGKLDAIEKYHMGFMTGISGIGFGLLTQMDKNLKADILLCKSVF